MFLRFRERPSGKTAVQIVENRRQENKVRQVVVRHVGQAYHESEIGTLKQLGESIIARMKEQHQPAFPIFPPENIVKAAYKEEIDDKVRIKDLREEQRVVDGIGEVFGKLYGDLGFENVLGDTNKDCQWNAILKSCVLARVANPASKMRTAALLEEDYGIAIPLQKIYRMMDHVFTHENKIKEQVTSSTLSLFPDKVDILFFDITTIYFESFDSDALRDFGFSKDCKFKEVQITLALITTEKGLPITYEIFPGDMYEGHTLIEMVKSLKERFDIKTIILVADRAMFNEDNLTWMDGEKIRYIVAAKLRGLSKLMKQNILESTSYKPMIIEQEFHWTKEFELKNRRLIVSYSSSRAKQDAWQRSRLIEKLLKKVKNGKIKLQELVTNHGTKKFVRVENATATINEAKIAEDSKWDGIHGVITNEPDHSIPEILRRYRGLWQIEEAFRINKHDLKMRPVYHWTPERIRAHISICFLAYTLAKQATYQIAAQFEPMSFERLRNELLHVQSSIVFDQRSGKKFVIPAKLTEAHRRIYSAFGLRRSDVPRHLN